MAGQSARDGFLKGVFLGIALLAIAQLGAGAWLAISYKPTLEGAHSTVQALRDEPIQRALLGFHYWGSGILILLCFAAVLGMAWAGCPKDRARAWFGMLLLGASSFALQVTGNLLPMDRHDVQSVMVESGIASRTPVAGNAIAGQMLQGDSFGQQTLSAWFFAHHWIFPAFLILGVALLLPGNAKFKGVAWAVWLPSAFALVLGVMTPGPVGAAATTEDFTRRDATVSWYAWPMHGALKAFDAWFGMGWIGAALLPLLFGTFLVFMPWISRKLSLAVVRTVLLLFLALYVVCGFFYGGKPAPLTGDQPVLTDEAQTTSQAKFLPVNPVLATKGKDLFNQGKCAGCHGLNGVGGTGGTKLTDEFRRHPDPDWLRKFIRNPESLRPGITMPSFEKMSKEDLDAIVEWLRMPK